MAEYTPVTQEDKSHDALEYENDATETTTEHYDSDDEVDANENITSLVRSRTSGGGLLAIYGVSTVMAVVSILLAIEFEESIATVSSLIRPSNHSDAPQGCAASPNLEDYPIWFSVLSSLIPVIKNLIHASLLGVTATVASVRGDALWLFFIRNVSMFFALAAFSFVLVDGQALLFLGRADFSMRFGLACAMFICCSLAFMKHNATCSAIKRLVHGRGAQGHGIPETAVDFRCTKILGISSMIVQVNAVVYAAYTTVSWMMESHPEMAGASLKPFEAAYSMGAHQAFLLSLINLGATFPRNAASIGGALLTSGWRTAVALSSFGKMWTSSASPKVLSFFFLATELMSMAPILLVSVFLTRRYYNMNSGKREESDLKDGACSTYFCPTTFAVARSDKYSSTQRTGAALISFGSGTLFIGMTGECALLLHQLATNAARIAVYQWGMHVCAMLVFVVAMSVSSPTMYWYARRLLLCMAPVGSTISLWQLSIIHHHVADWDTWCSVTVALLLCRTLSGVLQTLGLWLLDDLSASSLPDRNRNDSTERIRDSPSVASEMLTKARSAFFSLYLPSFAQYLVWSVVHRKCSTPMIPRLQGLTANLAVLFVFAKDWPGLGAFFHYGMLTVIFTADALTRTTPSFRPGLLVSLLFSGHVAGLLGMSMIYQIGHLKDSTGLFKVGFVSELLFASAAAYLSLRLCFLRRFREQTIY